MTPRRRKSATKSARCRPRSPAAACASTSSGRMAAIDSAASVFGNFGNHAMTSDNFTGGRKVSARRRPRAGQYQEHLRHKRGTRRARFTKDKIWFFTAHREWGFQNYKSDAYYEVNPIDYKWDYAPGGLHPSTVQSGDRRSEAAKPQSSADVADGCEKQIERLLRLPAALHVPLAGVSHARGRSVVRPESSAELAGDGHVHVRDQQQVAVLGRGRKHERAMDYRSRSPAARSTRPPVSLPPTDTASRMSATASSIVPRRRRSQRHQLFGDAQLPGLAVLRHRVAIPQVRLRSDQRAARIPDVDVRAIAGFISGVQRRRADGVDPLRDADRSEGPTRC